MQLRAKSQIILKYAENNMTTYHKREIIDQINQFQIQKRIYLLIIVNIKYKMQCSICLGTLKNPITMSCCQNKYCDECFKNWSKVRSVCPLCCAPTGEQEVNNLKNMCSSEQFDDGSLILEIELKQINNRLEYTTKRVVNKRQQFQDCKSTTSKSLMDYVEKQLEKAKLFKYSMEEQIVFHNRAGTVQYMQLLAEAILNLENALDNKIINFQDDFLNYDDYEDDYDDEYSEEQYIDYEEHEEVEHRRGTFKQRREKYANSKNNKPIKQN